MHYIVYDIFIAKHERTHTTHTEQYSEFAVAHSGNTTTAAEKFVTRPIDKQNNRKITATRMPNWMTNVNKWQSHKICMLWIQCASNAFDCVFLFLCFLVVSCLPLLLFSRRANSSDHLFFSMFQKLTKAVCMCENWLLMVRKSQINKLWMVICLNEYDPYRMTYIMLLR